MEPDKLALIKQKLTQLIKIGEVDDAARLAEAEGLLPEALDLYKKAKDHRSRGRIYEKLGQLDKALDVYEEGKLYDLAARVAEKLGLQWGSEGKVKVLKLQQYWLDLGGKEDLENIERFLRENGV